MAEEKKWDIINYDKSRSIAWLNSVNNAVALLGDEGKVVNDTKEWARDFIVEWRDWFLSEWDKANPKPTLLSQDEKLPDADIDL